MVIARLNDEEYQIYQRVLRRSSRFPKNKSDAFRLALHIVKDKLDQEAAELFYQNLDF